MLLYLNKLRDRYEERVDLINQIKEIKYTKNINNIYEDINKPNETHNSRENLNNISYSQNFNKNLNNDLYNFKMSENAELLKRLKKQINYMKFNKEE